MKIVFYIFGISFFWVINGCNSPYYQESYSFTDDTWKYDDPKVFEFEIGDTTAIYDMILTLNHTDQFPFQNLYLQTRTTFPSDSIIEQLLSLELSNAAGFWLGQCSGTNCSLNIPVQSDIHFGENGRYQLSLEQFTRKDTLSGLRSIGLSLIEQN